MKTLFLGDFGARVSAPVLAKAVEKFDATVLGDLSDTQRLIPAPADAEIVVGHIWKADFPAAQHLKLLQSPAAGIRPDRPCPHCRMGLRSATSWATSRRSLNTCC